MTRIQPYFAPSRFALILALAALCSATGTAALSAPEVELVRPAAGEELVGGSDAVLEWRPAGAALDAAIEEWEAFLSFNGGAYYAVRLTPHLDLSRRSFTFRVPDIPTDQARILLRFGDEEQEVSVDVAHRFSIRRAALPLAFGRGLPARERGESARPGEPGVVTWVDGSRQGDDLTLYETLPGRGMGSVASAGSSAVPPLLRRGSDRIAPPGPEERARAVVSGPTSKPGDAALPASPIRLLACRQNE